MPTSFFPRPLGLLFTGLLALLGQGGANAQPQQQQSSGPFTLQVQEKKSSLQFSANHGLHRVSYQVLRLLHNGRALALPDGQGGTRSELRDAWLLPGAPRPAVLVGGDAWVLVTEREGRPQIEVLSSQRGGSLQWVDTAEGPGAVHQSRVRLETPTLELQGGRLLLLDRHVLLDVQTLRWKPLALDLPAGYAMSESGLLGAAPDGRALAFLLRGESNSARDAAIVVAAGDGSGSELLPLDLKVHTGLNHVEAPADLLQRHFRWQLRDGAVPRLQASAPAAPGPWTSQYLFGLRAPRVGGRPVPRYTLAPVQPAMLAAARAQVLAHCGGQVAAPEPGDPPGDRFTRLKVWIVPVVMRLDAGSLVVESDHPDSVLWAQQTVRCIGEHLDAQLASGVLRPQLVAQGR